MNRQQLIEKLNEYKAEAKKAGKQLDKAEALTDTEYNKLYDRWTELGSKIFKLSSKLDRS